MTFHEIGLLLLMVPPAHGHTATRRVMSSSCRGVYSVEEDDIPDVEEN